MALVTVQRSPSPSNTAESDDVTDDGSNLKSPNRSRRSKSALQRLKKLFHTVRFISKLKPCFSESYFTVKGAALILPQNDVESTYTKKICKSSHGDIQSHLESMIALLRRQDTIALAVKLEMNVPDRHKYMAVVSCMGKQDTEESVILGIDFNTDNSATIGLVLPIWADTMIGLDGDGGFSITSAGNRHLFKPVTVQVMWFTLQSLNKLVAIAQENKYIANGLSHTWVSYYESSITSDIPRINEWYATEDLLFFRAEPVLLATDDDEEAFLKRIRVGLKNVMMKEDLDDATSKYLRTKLEEQMNMNLDKYKSYIDKEMLTILGQMDCPTLIKEHLYLGSEWNASNLEELTKNGVQYILNISKEIDNFFPGILHYYNIKEWDSEETDMLKYWENTHKYINKVREKHGKVLVHCKMGISRSASTVIAYLMKECNMSRQEAYDYVKEKRSCIMPNKAFWHQLETYEGILSASNQRHVFKQRSEVNLSEKLKAESEEVMTPDDFLGVYQEQVWDKELNETYPDVFLKDTSDNCSYDFDNEIASSSRSADSNEEFYPDLPSPQPEGATGGTDFIPDESDDSESSEDEEELAVCPPDIQARSPPTSKGTPGSNIVPKIILTKSPESKKESVDKITDQVINSGRKNLQDFGNLHSEIDLAQIEHDCSVESDKLRSVKSESDFAIHQHYLKENIPWSAGTVKKTKEGIEGKVKDVSMSSRSDDKVKDISSSSKTVPKISNSEQIPGDNHGEIQIVVTGEIKSQNLFQPIAGVTESETNVDMIPVQDNVKRPASVYDIEEISLPQGIVRKTTQEIEERNRTSNESPGNRSLQRSSSLKTERDTPRKKRRNSERRKTITSISSPCSSSYDTSPTKDSSFLDCLHNDSVFQTSFTNKEGDIKMSEQSSSDNISKDFKLSVSHYNNKTDVNIENEETVASKEQDLAVYKFLGEEVSLEKGIVKRQKMGIELMNRDRLSSDIEKNEGGNRSRLTSENEGVSSIPTTPTDGKKSLKEIESPTSAFKQITEESQFINMPKNVSKTTDVAESFIEEKMPLFSETKDNFERASAKNKYTDETLLQTPKVRRKLEPRFDADTLELIREIGSAILNSPAKAEVEDYEEEPAQLGSGLVRYYVKNIERSTKASKKKKPKEIVIIDKESQEKKRPWRWSSPADQKNGLSPSTDQPSQKLTPKSPLKQSVSSPILSTRHLIQSAKRFSDMDSHLSTSPQDKNMDLSKSPPRKTLGSHSPTCTSPDTTKTLGSHFCVSPDASKQKMANIKSEKPDLDEESLDFKRLVGRYEGTSPHSPGKHDTTVSLPEIKEANSCESLKNLGGDQTKDIESASRRQSDSEELFNEDCAKLRKIRNQLRSASLHSHRPKSIELVRRNSAASFGWFEMENKTEENQSGFSWEGKKVRKLQGKSHPLTKLELRRKFYNTM